MGAWATGVYQDVKLLSVFRMRHTTTLLTCIFVDYEPWLRGLAHPNGTRACPSKDYKVAVGTRNFARSPHDRSRKMMKLIILKTLKTENIFKKLSLTINKNFTVFLL